MLAEKSAAVRLGLSGKKYARTASVKGRPSGKTVLVTWLLPALESHGAVLMLAVALTGADGSGPVSSIWMLKDADSFGPRFEPELWVNVTVPDVALTLHPLGAVALW